MIGWEAILFALPSISKVAIGCFVLAGVCVLLVSDRVLVLSCAVMVPSALAGFNAGLTGNRKVLASILLRLPGGWTHHPDLGNRGKVTLAVVLPTRLTKRCSRRLQSLERRTPGRSRSLGCRDCPSEGDDRAAQGRYFQGLPTLPETNPAELGLPLGRGSRKAA